MTDPTNAEMTFEQSRSLFSYNPKTGVVRWRKRAGGRVAGTRAGSWRPDGSRTICVDGRDYAEHRVIWLLVTGEWPPAGIDHRNRKPGDNRWTNLRPATQHDNVGNTNLNKRNKTGVRGVCQSKAGSFIAQIGRRDPTTGKQTRVHLGTFATCEEASAVYDAAARVHFGEFYHPARAKGTDR